MWLLRVKSPIEIVDIYLQKSSLSFKSINHPNGRCLLVDPDIILPIITRREGAEGSTSLSRNCPK